MDNKLNSQINKDYLSYILNKLNKEELKLIILNKTSDDEIFKKFKNYSGIKNIIFYF